MLGVLHNIRFLGISRYYPLPAPVSQKNLGSSTIFRKLTIKVGESNG